MGFISNKARATVYLLVFLCCAYTIISTVAQMDCSMMTSLLSTCSNFLVYGMPEPTLSTPCCDGMLNLYNVANESIDNRRTACSCIMSLITDYSPNTTAIARLPGLCGVYFGFPIEPNTDCNNIVYFH